MTDPNDKQRQRDRHMRSSKHLRTRDEEQLLADARRAQQKPKKRTRDQADADDDYQKIRRREAVLDRSQKRQTIIPNSAQLTGTITWLSRGRALVLCQDGERTAILAPELARTQQSSVAVGDEVTLFEQIGAEATVVAVTERKSQLVRTDPGNEHRRRVLCANVDFVVLVLSADRARIGLIDRLLLALHDSGAELLVCINKCDLPHDREQLERDLRPHRQTDLPIVFASATRGDGCDELEQLVRTRTVPFVGHSGVGKSTLLNVLDPGSLEQTAAGHEQRATGAVRDHDGKGRHTTTASRLRVLADGTRLIDTPGVRAFGLSDAQTDHTAAFEDVLAYADSCRFRNCAHRTEPGCAVRAAVDAGELTNQRYQSFLQLS